MSARDIMVVCNMAMRNFDENVDLVVDELKGQEAKRYYLKTLLSRTASRLSHESPDFEGDINELINQINDSCK